VAGFRGPTALLRELVHHFFGREEGVDSMTADGVRAQLEMLAYFAGLIAHRYRAQLEADDALGALLSFKQDGEPIPDEEVASNLMLLLLGATDTLPKVLAIPCGSTKTRAARGSSPTSGSRATPSTRRAASTCRRYMRRRPARRRVTPKLRAGQPCCSSTRRQPGRRDSGS
jgi:hypothetical protein